MHDSLQLENIVEKAVNILSDLVAFQSLSRQGNTDIIDYIDRYLKGFGLQTYRVTDENADKPHTSRAKSYNLFTTIGTQQNGGLLLSGHTDVVPAQAKSWSTDPFTLSLSDFSNPAGTERLYGRGTSDMKGFLACILALVPVWMQNPEKRQRTPLHLAFTYDEEIGCVGVDDLIAEIGKTLPVPDATIVGEPTSLLPVNGHKSASRYITRIKGRSAHSSNPAAGINAIYAGQMVIQKIQEIFEEIKSEALSASLPKAQLFDPPYSTLSLGTIHGGSAVNVVPETCEIGWEARTLPWEEPHLYMDRIKEFCVALSTSQPHGQKTVFSHEIESFLPGLTPQENSTAYNYYKAMMQAGGKTALSPSTVSFGTEAGKYDKAGIPSLIWGPGSIAQAHKPDEYIEKQQIIDCCNLLSFL